MLKERLEIRMELWTIISLMDDDVKITLSSDPCAPPINTTVGELKSIYYPVDFEDCYVYNIFNSKIYNSIFIQFEYIGTYEDEF